MRLLTTCVFLAAAALAQAPKPRTTGQSPKATTAPAAAAAQRVNPKDGLTYVWIPPGTFTMGCSPRDAGCYENEKPAHKVTIPKGFWIGQTEVTQEAFQWVMNKNPSGVRGARLPVSQVPQEDAQAYCRAVGMRLPTEAEWEYAARGGDTSPRYGPVDTVAWYGDNCGNRTHEVGQKQKNGFGLYDMLGNVWEWTGDFFEYEYYASSPQTDPKGPSTGPYLTLRGGSWHVIQGGLRVSVRNVFTDVSDDVAFGLRCVQN